MKSSQYPQVSTYIAVDTVAAKTFSGWSMFITNSFYASQLSLCHSSQRLISYTKVSLTHSLRISSLLILLFKHETKALGISIKTRTCSSAHTSSPVVMVIFCRLASNC